MMLLALLAAAAVPQPSEVRTFQDWTVACDNGLRCEAVALMPSDSQGDPDWEAWITLMLRRGAHPTDRPVLILQGLERTPTTLLADGRSISARFTHVDDGFVVRADEATLIEAVRYARVLEVRGADNASLGRISLAGASAAMLYMDERQRRLDTVTAMVRRGARPASAVPAPPAVPQVRIAAPPTDRPLAVEAAALAAIRNRLECTEFDVRGDDAIETFQIATGRTLVLIPCGSGAYNFSSVPVIAQRQSGRVTTAIAPFDSQWGLQSEGHPLLTNADWDPQQRRLSEYSKGRGLGDCGTRADYAWDGTRFRLIHQEEMEECRGSLYYVTTYRAETVSR